MASSVIKIDRSKEQNGLDTLFKGISFADTVLSLKSKLGKGDSGSGVLGGNKASGRGLEGNSLNPMITNDEPAIGFKDANNQSSAMSKKFNYLNSRRA